MPLIRKDRAGNDSLGHSWPEDGAVVDMPHEEAEALLAIPDGGFTLVVPPDEEAGPEDPDSEVNPEFSEVDPEAPTDEPDAKPAAKKTTARKTAAHKPVEE
jgi:hypothetical protein